ncbi:MAG: DNA methyltransferase, partial [Chloroflexi bacterium]|nr:DNA methyltransferase [Chloroflexota bacterium]
MTNLDTAIAAYGASLKAKLGSPVVSGQPEDQLRAPFGTLLEDMVEVLNWRRADITVVGESSLPHLQVRPDFAVTYGGALVGHVELKAPGKGANPTKFKDPHDKEQWKRLRSLPNLMYSDGNEFSLWTYGEPAFKIIRLNGDVQTSGTLLRAPATLPDLFLTFLTWQPIPPRNARDLAMVSARLCRLLRDEVTEQLATGSAALNSLAADWRKLLFPEATNETFADGYSQAVTFGLLMARARNIPLNGGFNQIAQELGHTSTLIGAALRLLTDQAVNQGSLKTSLDTL